MKIGLHNKLPILAPPHRTLALGPRTSLQRLLVGVVSKPNRVLSMR